jgi:predicted dehydrogenase
MMRRQRKCYPVHKENHMLLLKTMKRSTSFIISGLFCQMLHAQTNKPEVKLVTLAPAHFHAALVQKSEYDNVDLKVHVYAPEGPDVQMHLERINGYNKREMAPTDWKEVVYTGPDFFNKMISERKGNVVVIAGNNAKKTDYILKSLQAGFNVLADKPMAINTADFKLLQQAFETAKQKKLLLYDIMTERFEITTILQRELSLMPEIFGKLQKGTTADPAITKESVHHFYKYVSGNVLTRPAWFMDVTQEGEGIVDVTTHLVDLVQWECFPDQVIDYKNDIQVLTAKRWPMKMTASEFNTITKLDKFPDYLNKDKLNDTTLQVYCNGEINYRLKGVHAKVSVIWNYKAPEGGGDTHFSKMRGTRSNLVIRQGKEQNYKSTLYIEPLPNQTIPNIQQVFGRLQLKYPGISLKQLSNGWEVEIPQTYREDHEAHFARVTKKFLDYLQKNNMPAWEVPNMLAKYYTTTTALQMAKANK